MVQLFSLAGALLLAIIGHSASALTADEVITTIGIDPNIPVEYAQRRRSIVAILAEATVDWVSWWPTVVWPDSGRSWRCARPIVLCATLVEHGSERLEALANGRFVNHEDRLQPFNPVHLTSRQTGIYLFTESALGLSGLS